MKILVAEAAGFCFGVNNAVNMVYNLLDVPKGRIYTLGPIIHNTDLVSELRDKGVEVISDVSEAEEGSIVVIRAHGVTPECYDQMKEKRIRITDATCPYVKKIHKMVEKKHNEGCSIIIAGDKLHPEVIGINGWCKNEAYIVDSPEAVGSLPEIEGKCCIVAQTTFIQDKWEKINEKLKEKCQNIERFDTICSATSKRQAQAEKIAAKSDMMLVIGSKNSSNTQKLYEICKKKCSNTLIIERFGDLPPIDIAGIKTLGITAGASAPDRIIKEVIEKMDELNKQEQELSFGEAFESSIVTLRSGEVAKGTIIGFNNQEVFVNLGYKSDGIIPVSEYSDDPDFKPENSLKIGDEIEVYIVRVNDGEGTVLLSKKRVDSAKGIEFIEEAYENKTSFEAKVVDVTKGGLIAVAKGVRIFIPASQIGGRYVKDLTEHLKQTLTIRILEFNRQKRKIVGSQRVLLEENRNRTSSDFWETVEVGKKYAGTVKSLMDFGAFVDIGGIDGLVHVSELSWTKIKHPSEVLNVNDQVEVTVLDFDQEKKRISLGYKKAEDNPWVQAAGKYAPGDLVKGKVVRLVPFGAFVELAPGIDGLVHISQISNVRIAKPGDVLEIGQEIEAKVIEFNFEAKKINLSIKDANPIEPVEPVAAEAQAQVSETPVTEAAEAAIDEVVESGSSMSDAFAKAEEKAEE